MHPTHPILKPPIDRSTHHRLPPTAAAASSVGSVHAAARPQQPARGGKQKKEKMAETVEERSQDLVLASLFLLIAVVALVKCRRVVVLEGAEVSGLVGRSIWLVDGSMGRLVDAGS
jgi:hypothetical protein